MIVRSHAQHATRAVSRAAFTLMEVLVVVAILVILAGVGSVAVFKYMDDAKENAARLGIAKIEQAAISYKTKHGEFPQSLQELTKVEGSGAYLEDKDLLDPWNQPYIYNPSELHPQSRRPHISAQGPDGLISNW
jgi:general secretion pathway protein G